MRPHGTDESCDAGLLPFLRETVAPFVPSFQKDFQLPQRQKSGVSKNSGRPSTSAKLEQTVDEVAFDDPGLQDGEVVLQCFHKGFSLLGEVFNHERTVAIDHHSDEQVYRSSVVLLGYGEIYYFVALFEESFFGYADSTPDSIRNRQEFAFL